MESRFYLFLDECGDQNLSNFDPSFPIFTLCGVVMSQQQLDSISHGVVELKQKYWCDKKIILHSRDIRKCEKGFEILFDLNVKRDFYADINNLIGSNLYRIISCSILKEPYIRKYGKMSDVYSQSLSFIIERSVFYLDSIGMQDISLYVIIEKRGKREDGILLNYYNKLIDTGTYWVTPERIKKYFKSFELKAKSENIIGLQIADLLAYPITRYVLDPEAVNMPYDILKKNIYEKDGKLYGQKVFP